MRTNVLQCICPNCKSLDRNQIIRYKLIDSDLSIERQCLDCQIVWIDNYGLFYLGFSNDKGNYDRDGLAI